MGNATRAVVAMAGVVVLAACSPASPEPTVPPTTPAVDQDTPASTPTQGAEAEVLDVYFAYWDASVVLLAGNLDRSVFDGVATDEVTEERLNDGEYVVENNLEYQGEPTFTDVTVEIIGESANVSACVDSSAWYPERVEPEGDMVEAGATKLERIDGAWLVVGPGEIPEGLTC